MEMDARRRSVKCNRSIQTRRLFRRYFGISTASLALMLLAGPVSALSCLRPDVAFSYTELAAADEEYVVLFGSFEEVPPKPLNKKQSQATVTFAGEILTPKGFSPLDPVEVDVVLTCAGMWCAELEAETPYLAFVEKTPDGPRLDVGPCYTHSFKSPTQRQLETAQSCISGGPCQSDG